jgi:hypothetical protein
VLSPGGRSPLASAICCLAGAAAEARLVGTGYASACKVDVEDAKAYLTAINLSVSDVWPEALKLIDRYRELIELVADALIRSGELDGAQFHKLVEQAAVQGDRPRPVPALLSRADLEGGGGEAQPGAGAVAADRAGAPLP